MTVDDGLFATCRACSPTISTAGAHGERTLRRNRQAFERHAVTPRGLQDVSRVDLATRCFGRDWRMPVMLAPVGFAGMFHAEGESAPRGRQRGAAGIADAPERLAQEIRDVMALAGLPDIAALSVPAAWSGKEPRRM